MTNAQETIKEKTTLFERLGGHSGVSEIVKDAVEAHMNNPVIKVRFLPYKEDPENLKKIKEHLVQFFSAGSGAQVEYHGKEMPDAHRGMNINAEEYMAAIDDIMSVLEKHNIDENSRNEVLAILWSLKGMIMAK
ncbi:MAG: group 1 truncated hemoglobin [Chitinophagales bacterium]